MPLYLDRIRLAIDAAIEQGQYSTKVALSHELQPETLKEIETTVKALQYNVSWSVVRSRDNVSQVIFLISWYVLPLSNSRQGQVLCS